MSEARWRQIVSGYQMVSGHPVPVTAPAETIARMAQALVSVTPEQLEEAGRTDAAEELRTLAPLDEPPEEPLSLSELSRRYAELERVVLEHLPPEVRRQWETQHGRGDQRGLG